MPNWHIKFFKFLFRKLKHKILRKPLPVATGCSLENLGFHTVEFGKIYVEQAKVELAELTEDRGELSSDLLAMQAVAGELTVAKWWFIDCGCGGAAPYTINTAAPSAEIHAPG